jgi:PIN domain nuclease of toxin-antitoxin system
MIRFQRISPKLSPASSAETPSRYPHPGLDGWYAQQFDELVERFGLEVLAIDPRHAIAAAELPQHHNDPFDRMLVAQARLGEMALVTEDHSLSRYEVTIFSRGTQ